MQYISLINQFWRMRRTTNISHAEVDLYFYLINEANELRWQIQFTHPTRLICAALSMSNKVFAETRNRLKQKGLIDFTPGSRGETASYTIIDICASQGNVKGNSSGNATGNPPRNSTRNSNPAPSLREEREDETRPEEKEKNSNAHVSFCSPTFDECHRYFKQKVGVSLGEAGTENLAVRFFNFYESKGWMVGVNPMIAWTSAADGWIIRNKTNQTFGGNNAKNTPDATAGTHKRGGTIAELRSVLAKWDEPHAARSERSSTSPLLSIVGSVGT